MCIYVGLAHYYSSFPFWIFTLLSCAAITFVLVLWVVKKPTTPFFESFMQLFFEGAEEQDEDPAEAGMEGIFLHSLVAALRRWREGREEAWVNEEASENAESRDTSVRRRCLCNTNRGSTLLSPPASNCPPHPTRTLFFSIVLRFRFSSKAPLWLSKISICLN